MADYKRTISPDMHLAYLRQGAIKEMAGFSHTPACCMSKLRSSLEAGKKQPIVWLQYVCSVAGVLLNPSFDSPLVLLWSLYGESVMIWRKFEEDFKRFTSRSKINLLFYE